MNIYLSYLILLRIIHILGGAFWIGGSLIHVAFIEPTAKATAPEGSKFVQYLVGRGRFSLFMVIASSLSVLSGAVLYWHSSGGLQSAWIGSGPGLVYTFGSLAGIAVYLVGMFMVRPRVDRLEVLGREMEAAGAGPAAPQIPLMQRLDQELSIVGRVDFGLLAISTLAMAAARYSLM
jgi:uncharacterized membrane protein